MSVSSNHLGNPRHLGLFGFAMTTWLLSLINAGFFDAKSMGLVVGMAFAFGGTTQMIAGIMEFKRGNTFGLTTCIGFGAFWWSWALFVVFFQAETSGVFIAWYLALWATFTLVLLLAALKYSLILKMLLFFAVLTLYVLAIGSAAGSLFFTRAGGYLGLVTAFCAFYIAAAGFINESYGKTILPV